MLKRFVLIASALTVFVLVGCQSLKQGIALTQCNYSYQKIGDVTFMGHNFANGVRPSQLTSILSAFTGGVDAAPLSFVIYTNVDNPNNRTAAIEHLKYRVYLDDVFLTEGETTEPFYVLAGEKSVLPLLVDVDLKTLLSGDNRAVYTKIIKNFVGINSDPVKVKVQLKPTLKVGNNGHLSTGYIPVHFTYYGKNAK